MHVHGAKMVTKKKTTNICRHLYFWFGLVLWHINHCRLFNAKAILLFLEEQWWCYLTHSWEDKGVHTFPKGICLKVNIILFTQPLHSGRIRHKVNF